MIRRSSLSAPVRITALLLVLVFAATGCHRGSKKNAEEGMPVEQLFEKSHKLMEGGNWSGAESSFKRLVAQYPYGPYTEQAMIESAYAQYKAGRHDDAVSSIDRFIRTYPTHRNIAYLYYLRGLANANRDTVFLRRVWSLDSSRRDLSAPRQAFADFGIVVDRYPNSRYAADARERMGALRNTFALGELNSGLYYLRRGAWTSAAGRANFVLETYPDTAYQADAIALLAASYEGMGNQALASSARSQLASVNAQHPYLSGDWPNYSWMIRKLNPFAGEKSPLTGERNATINRD